MSDISLPSEENGYQAEHAELLLQSYLHLLGVPLLVDSKTSASLAEQLFKAPFALVSHTTDGDPVFNYANLTALSLFEFSWEEFITLPSRLSAEPVNRQERERLLAEVADKGFIRHYEGVRISKTGKRFRIRRAVVWNLADSEGIYRGQAACFGEWEYLYKKHCRVDE